METRTGGPADIERLVADYPDLANELRDLWAAAAVAEEFGSLPANLRIDDSEKSAAGSAAGRLPTR